MTRREVTPTLRPTLPTRPERPALATALLAVAGLVVLALAAAPTAQATHDGPALEDDFEDPPLDAVRWPESGGANIQGDCGSASGSAALKFGGARHRFATTRGVDVADGGVVSFAIRFGEGPLYYGSCIDDNADRDMVVEYSVDGGTTWFRIARVDDTTKSWTSKAYAIPAPAQTGDTIFRWRQLGPDEFGRQHAAIDDVGIGAGLTAPTDVRARPGAEPGTARVAWSAPAETGGVGVDHYEVRRSSPGEAAHVVATADGGTTSVVDDGLDAGTTYRYTVVASNAHGESPPSEPAQVAGTGPVEPGVEAGEDVVRVEAPEVAVGAHVPDPEPPAARVEPRIQECTPRDVVCVGPSTPASLTHDLFTPTLVGEADASVRVGRVSAAVAPGFDGAIGVGPFGVGGPVPVTVCASTCEVPADPSATHEVDADVEGRVPHLGVDLDLP